MESAGKTMANRYWAWERTLEEYQHRQKEIERIIKDNDGKPSGVAAALKKLFGTSGHTLTMPDPGKKNGYRFVGFIRFETRGVIVERYPEDTPSGEREEVQFTWTDVAKAMIDRVKSKKEEPQADGTGTALASADAGEHAELLGSVDAQRARMMYEARIQLYKEQIGTGYIGIGRTLNEAKASGAIPHGEWAEWVTRTTGLEIRQAQRCMQAATEIKDGSALARLEMSKALLLLSSGLDEEAREQVAEKAAEEGATVKGLKEEIRRLKLEKVQSAGAVAEIREALKKAQAERAEIEQQMTAAMNEYKAQMDNAVGDAYRRGMTDQAEGLRADLRKEFQGKIDFINGERKRAEKTIGELQERLQKMENDGRHAWDYGFEAGKKEAAEIRREVDGKRKMEIDNLQEALDASEKELEGVRREADNLRRNQGDLLAAAEDAEKRAADAEAELEQLRAGRKADAEPAVMVLSRALAAFFGECELMPYYPESLRGHRQPILESIAGLEAWCERMRGALDAAVPAEGAVE